MSNQCIGFVGRLMGHSYQAQFDVTPQPFEAQRLDGKYLLRLADLMNQKVYRGSLCKRCGSVVKEQA